MRTVCDIDKCTGCGLCSSICPNNSIKIVDELTRFVSIIDEGKCIKCEKCVEICPENHSVPKHKPIAIYQGWSKNAAIRSSSSSGGLAAAIMEYVISNGGIVCSCVFKEGAFSYKVSRNINDIRQFRGSKYVKSELGLVIDQIRRTVKKNELIAFIGLPCHVAAIKKALPDYSNLYTIDLICHGTPSVHILKQYLLEKGIEIEKIKDISFRKNNTFMISADVKKTVSIKDSYMVGYLNGLFYTDNCYSCQYAALERCSDITVGDAWGSDLSKKELSKGVSLILCQNKHSNDFVRKLNVELSKIETDSLISHNKQLNSPACMPKMREVFFDRFSKHEKFDFIIWSLYPIKSAKHFVKLLLKSILR